MESLDENVDSQVALLPASFVKLKELVPASIDLALSVLFVSQTSNYSIDLHTFYELLELLRYLDLKERVAATLIFELLYRDYHKARLFAFS